MKEVIDHIPFYMEFERQYLLLREAEGRIYSDDQLKRLPEVSKQHPLFQEWKLRKHSAGKLVAYLEKQNRALKILEVGCGNGWLANQLSMNPGCRVTGIDVNSVELEQAKRVFEKPQLRFVYGDIRNVNLHTSFDLVVFAASLQYFASLPEIIYAGLEVLLPGGEIHIIDTHFYKNDELADAVQRSKAYFQEIGFPVMERYYFHHSIEGLDEFSYQVLYDPASLPNRIFKHSPFPWIRIKKC